MSHSATIEQSSDHSRGMAFNPLGKLVLWQIYRVSHEQCISGRVRCRNAQPLDGQVTGRSRGIDGDHLRTIVGDLDE